MRYELEDDMEFVVEFNDGGRDWVDPVINIEETEDELVVTYVRWGENEHRYAKVDVKSWTIQPRISDED
jgi:hypothetical protein